MNKEIMTGWFGIPGGVESDSTKVHVCKARTTGSRAGLLPVCGTYIGPQQAFQFCSYGVTLNYVECGECKKSKEYQAELSAQAEAYAKWKMQWANLGRRKPLQKSKSNRRGRARPLT